MIQVAVADDHELFIEGLSNVLATEKDMQVVGKAFNGESVLNVLAQNKVDVILLDIHMPDTDVIKLTAHLQKKYPHLKIVILTMCYGTRYYTKLLKYNIKGYLHKSVNKHILLEAIRRINAGELYISNNFMGTEASKKELYSSYDSSQSSSEQLLTKREIEILKLIALEHSNNEIAEKLFISTGTVDTHRKNIILKLGVKNTVGLIKIAIKRGLVK